uniref:ribonucleoside-diphosphate reductase n=1 Tax=Archaeoglobus fulgidus TaxID=2234 RepID=A0A7C2S801_ARCFL
MRKIPRPRAVEGLTYQVLCGCGKIYVTVNFLDKKPFEVFIRMGHSGGCNYAQTEAIGRLISLALRCGVPLEEITKQLKNIRCPKPLIHRDGTITSCADAIARTLEHFIKGAPVKEPDEGQARLETAPD